MAKLVKVAVGVCLNRCWIGGCVCLFESVAICLFESVLNRWPFESVKNLWVLSLTVCYTPQMNFE